MAALESRFTKSMPAVPLIVLTTARSPRSRALRSTEVLSSSRRPGTISRLYPLITIFFFIRLSLLE